MNNITVTIPIPQPGCDSNSRVHWALKAKHKAVARDDACTAGMVAVAGTPDWKSMGMPWRSASLLIRWYHPTVKHRDRDNIVSMLKASIDGLVDAGILFDDDQLTVLPVERFTDKSDPRVELVITKTEQS